MFSWAPGGKKSRRSIVFFPESSFKHSLRRFRSKEGKENQHSQTFSSLLNSLFSLGFISFLWPFLFCRSSMLYISAPLEFTAEFAARQDTGDSLGENRERLMVQQFYIGTSGNEQAGEGQLLLYTRNNTAIVTSCCVSCLYLGPDKSERLKPLRTYRFPPAHCQSLLWPH